MCECKGGYICPQHTVFKSSVVTQKPKTQKRKGMTVRQAIEVMGRNKIGRTFARNDETSDAVRILMGAYKSKSGKIGCPSLQQVINYLTHSPSSSSSSSSLSSNEKVAYYIERNGSLGYYVLVRTNSWVKYLNKNGDLLSAVNPITKDGTHGYFESATDAARARDVYKNKQSTGGVDQSVIKDLNVLATRIARHSITIERQTLSKNSNIIRFSVSKYDIVAAYRAAGIHFAEYNITLNDPLQEIGLYIIKIDLAHGIKTEAKVWVVPTAT